VTRILVCAPGVPHKSRGASSVLFYHYIDQLLRAGYEVLCLLLLEKPEDAAELRAELRQTGNCEVLTAAVNPLLRFGKYSGAPIAGELPPAAIERARAFGPDVVLYFDLGCLAVARALGQGKRRLVWLGDLAFHALWHHALYDAREGWRALFRLPKMWLICRRWKAAYARYLSDVDRVIVSSHSSEAALRPLKARARYLPYPWPVEKPFRSAASPQGKPRFLFCGTLSGLGSRSAIYYLLNSLYPELLRRWGRGGFQILVTGTRSLPDWAMASIREKPEVLFEGFVEDLYERMDRCHAAIVPIDVPVGNRSRIVSAMGYGLLVIAHPNTAMGNPDLVSGETCLLADSPGEFARQMAKAYEDRALAERIQRSARAAYERSFEPRRAAAMLIDEVRALA
jgi:glycosyltransferase involved in cell wall biosynthesis